MSLATKLVDLINPMVLRESRKLTRGKLAFGILIAFMLLMFASASIYVLTAGENSYNPFSKGKDMFMILFMVLSYSCILFVPLYCAFPLLLQKKKGSMELLMISTIKPRAIIWGKLVSAFWMMVLFFSVSMPFMVFSTLLRGISLVEVFSLLTLLACVVLVATTGLVLLVCLPISTAFAIILGIIYTFYLVLTPMLLVAFTEFRTGTLSLIIIVPSTILCVVLGAATATALIAPVISNRALGVRITATICWLISGITSAICGELEVWSAVLSMLLALTFIVSASETTKMSQRVKGEIPKQMGRRILAFPWFSGALNGLVWASILLIITLFLGEDDTQMSCTVISTYFLIYALLALWLRSLPLIRRIPEKFTSIIIIILWLCGTLFPIIAHFIANPGKDPDLLWDYGNIFTAIETPLDHLGFVTYGLAVFALLNTRWIARQISNFCPPNPVKSESSDA